LFSFYNTQTKMKFSEGATLLLALPMAAAVAERDNMVRPLAIIYRGVDACRGCPESVGELLTSSPFNFDVKYAGPDEDMDLSDELLSKAKVYAYPGGPGEFLQPQYFTA
jgi:hypothetical protein